MNFLKNQYLLAEDEAITIDSYRSRKGANENVILAVFTPHEQNVVMQFRSNIKLLETRAKILSASDGVTKQRDASGNELRKKLTRQ